LLNGRGRRDNPRLVNHVMAPHRGNFAFVMHVNYNVMREI
jgi:hypothetical protein